MLSSKDQHPSIGYLCPETEWGALISSNSAGRSRRKVQFWPLREKKRIMVAHVLTHQPLHKKKQRCVTGWKNCPQAHQACELIPVPSAVVMAQKSHHLFLSFGGAFPCLWEPSLYQLKLAIFNKTQMECIEDHIILRLLSQVYHIQFTTPQTLTGNRASKPFGQI